MSSPSPAVAPRFAVRYVQLSRAGIAVLAALMITFSPDHSAAVGLSVFSGFGMATALVMFAAAWLTYPAGRRWAPNTVGALSAVAGIVATTPGRGATLLFAVVICWALGTGLVELVAGLQERRRAGVARAEARDTLTVAVLTLLLAMAVAIIPAEYALDYTIADADTTFTLTGTTIAVGVFGAYAAVVAVYLAIAGFTPRQPTPGGTAAVPASSKGQA